MSDRKDEGQRIEEIEKEFDFAKNAQRIMNKLSRPKHRYMVITGPIEAAHHLCARMDDEGFDIISVSSVFMQAGNQVAQLATITGLILRDAPKTALEIEVEAEQKRLVQPVKGKFN